MGSPDAHCAGHLLSHRERDSLGHWITDDGLTGSSMPGLTCVQLDEGRSTLDHQHSVAADEFCLGVSRMLLNRAKIKSPTPQKNPSGIRPHGQNRYSSLEKSG